MLPGKGAHCPALRLGLRVGWPRGRSEWGTNRWLPGLQSTSLTRALKAICLDVDKPSHVKNGSGPRGVRGNYKFNAFSIIAGACACPPLGEEEEATRCRVVPSLSIEGHQRVNVMISGQQRISASTRTKLLLYGLILSFCLPACLPHCGIILLGLIIAGSIWPLSQAGCNLIYRWCLTLSCRQ